jgi:hypothetical protein
MSDELWREISDELTRRVLSATGTCPPLSLDTFSNRADAQTAQEVMDILMATALAPPATGGVLLTTDDTLVLVDPTDPSAAVPDFPGERAPAAPAPPLWWLRPDVPDTWLHRAHPTAPGKTACNLTLNAHFRPATGAELTQRRKCRICVPRPAHAPKRRAVRG